MDSITQAVLGAAIGEAALGKKIGNKGAIIGAVIATIPDLDVFLMPFYSDLQRLSVHRGYSHSILFSILGAFIFAYILSRIKWTKTISKARLWIFTWLALFTHMLLDAFTSFGTQLFLPFSDYRVSFDSISIIDPVYTLPLLIGLLLALFVFKKPPKRSFYNNIGLVVSSLYLLFTLFNKRQVEDHFAAALFKQNINFNKMLSVPVSVANMVWYGVAKNNDGLYIGKYALGQKEDIRFEYFPTNDKLLEGLDPYMVDRLRWFSQGFYTVAKNNGKIRLYNMQCDMQGVRYFGEYKAPTAFYFELTPKESGGYSLSSGMHPKNAKE